MNKYTVAVFRAFGLVFVVLERQFFGVLKYV